MKHLEVSESAHHVMKQASIKSKIPIKELTELLITSNVNFLYNPVDIAKKMDMVKKEN